MSDLRIRFVGTHESNLFMTELLEVIAAGVRDAGADAQVVLDGFPPSERDTISVVIPHELFPLVDAGAQPTRAQLAQTVALCTEQPGTVWFEKSVVYAMECGAVADISRVGVATLRARGIHARHVQLGYTQMLDSWSGDPTCKRPVDILYMGSAAQRRERFLASYADVLARRATTMLVPPHWLKPRERADFVVGAAKRALIARAQILLSVRRQEQPYFEWVRALDAISNGAVFVCDHGAGFEPLVPGEHFVSAAPEALHLVADALLREPAELERIRRSAYEIARERLRLSDGVQGLIEAAEELRGAGARTSAQGDARRVWDETSVGAPGPEEPPGRHDDPEQARAELTAIERRRDKERHKVAAEGLDPDELVELHRTPAYHALRARVTVCVPAYRAADVIEQALASVAAQDLAAIEVLVHDDACPDHSGDIAAAWFRRHPWLAGRVLRRRANAGLPAGRNAMARLARAPYLLMLDADNELLPSCAGALAAALDEDPSATFAYPVIAVHRDGEPKALLSYLDWDPELLRAFNPIDALAMIRRNELLELGGYTEDLSLYGWEDYDFWCRCAEAGLHGVHVRRPLARYHRSAGSMLSVTDLDQGGRMALLRLRHPRTMAS